MKSNENQFSFLGPKIEMVTWEYCDIHVSLTDFRYLHCYDI